MRHKHLSVYTQLYVKLAHWRVLVESTWENQVHYGRLIINIRFVKTRFDIHFLRWPRDTNRNIMKECLLFYDTNFVEMLEAGFWARAARFRLFSIGNQFLFLNATRFARSKMAISTRPLITRFFPSVTFKRDSAWSVVITVISFLNAFCSIGIIHSLGKIKKRNQVLR